MPVRLAVGDISTFRKYVKNIGRAYQKRSVAMIQLCRLFLEISSGKPDQSDALKGLFEIVEDALRSAVEAGKGRSEVADDAFATAEERLDQYAWHYHSSEQTVIGDVHDIIEDAAQKDSQIMKTYSRLSSRLGFNKTETPRSLVKVRFQVLHSPTDRHLAPIVTCELGPEVNVSELLWTFSRLPEDQRVTLKQNPHFYLSRDLSERPLAYDDDFVLKPLKDLKPEKDLVVLILSDRTGQIYFDYEKFSKTYGNIWRPHNTIILKDLQGTLEAANRISSKINGDVCIWQRGGDRHDEDLTEWTTVLDQALDAPDTDWLIRSETSLDEAFDIEVTGGWERCSPIPMPEPAPVFGMGNSITSMPSHEDVLTPPEDVPSPDSGSTLDSSGQSLYYLDDAGPSDDTAATSLEEVRIDVECFPPAEDAVSMVPEVPSPSDSGVQLETAVPSPVSTPHALPELLDPHALDAVSNVFTSEIIITPKKTHLLVETAHVPLEPTPPSELPTPPVSNDGDLTLDSTPPLSESFHPQSQLVHPPTPPTHESNAPAPSIVTSPEHARRPVEPVHLPAQPVHSPPSVVTWSTESKPAPKSEVTTSHERKPQQVEDVTPPVHKPAPSSSASALSAPFVAALRKLSLTSRPAPAPEVVRPTQSRPEPQVPAAPVIKPAPSSSATVPSAPVAAPRKLSITSKPAPEPIEVARPAQSHPEPQVLAAPVVIKPAPSSSVTNRSGPVAAPRKLSITSKPAPEPIEVVRPAQSRPEPQVLTAPTVIKLAPSSSVTNPSAPVAASRKLSITSKPAPELIEVVVRPAQSRPEPQVLAAPAVIKPAPSSSATAPVATSRKLSLTSKQPEPQQVQVQAARPPVQPVVSAAPITKHAPEPIEVVRPLVQPVQSRPEPQVPAPTPPVIKSAPSSSATVAASRKLSITSKQPEPQQVQVQAVRPPVQPVVSAAPITKPAPEPIEAVRPPVQPIQSRPEPQVPAAPVIKSVPSSSATVATSRKLSLTSKQPEPQQVQVQAIRPPVQPVVSAAPITKHAPEPIEAVRPPVQPRPEPHVPAAPVIKSAPSSSATVAASRKLSLTSKQPEPQQVQVQVVRPPVQPVQAQVSSPPITKPAPASIAAVPSAPVAKPTLSSKPEPQQLEVVRSAPQVSTPPVIKPVVSSAPKSDVQPNLAPKPAPEPVEVVRSPVQPAQVSVAPVVKPAVASGDAVPSAPKSDAPVSLKPAHTPNPTPEPSEALRPPVQAQPGPQVSAAPVIKSVPSSAPVAVSRNLIQSSKPVPKQVETVRPLAPAPSSGAAVPNAPKNDVPAQNKPILTWRSAPEQVAVQPAHAHPGPKPVPSRNAAAPAASPDLHTRIPEASTPHLHGNLAAGSRASPDRVSAVPESARTRVETVHRSVQPVPAHQSLTSSTGGRPAPAGSASTSTVRTAQHTRPVGNVSATERTTLTPSGTRSQAAAVPRPVQVSRPPPGSSAVPVRHGPVPAGSIPSPYIRSQVGAGRRTSTLASHAPPSASRVPPIGSNPAGSAPGPEVSRRIKSHPRKMVTTVGQRRSVVMPAPPPVTQPTAPPPELPKSPPVQQPTTRSAPQNSSSQPLQQGVPTRMPSIPSLLEAQDKPKIRTVPTPAPAVPTAPSAAPPTRVDDMARAPTPTLRERGSRISIADSPTTGRSRRPTIVAEPETPRRAVRASVLSPMNPEQSATGPPPSRGSSSTPISRQDRASVVLPETSTQKRADPASIPARRDSAGTTTATNPTPAPRAMNTAAPVGNTTVLSTPAAPNGSPTPPIKPAPQMTARLPAQSVTLSRQQQPTEPVTSPLPNNDHVSPTRRSETRKSSYYGSRTETPGLVSGAETPQGEHRHHYSATAALSRQQQVGSVDVTPGPVLRSSGQRITSRIRTRDLINRHKPQPAIEVRPPSTISPSVGSPTWSKSPISATSQPTPTTPDPNRTDSGIEMWDYNARSDRHRASANGDKKGLADGASKLHTVLESSDRRSSRVPLHHRDSTMSISKSHSKSAKPPAGMPATGSPQVEPPASTPPGPRGGAFLTRKPQGSFQSGYPETSTPPRSSTPSSMTHASTAATSTQASLVTPASSFPNLSSLNSKAQPKSWFRRNVLDPFKTRLGLAPA